MARPVEIKCSGCGFKTTVDEGSKLHREVLCRPCFDAWMDLDKRASAEYRKERRRWVTLAQRGHL